MAILPELMLLTAATAFFVLSLFQQVDNGKLKNTAIFFGIVTLFASLAAYKSQATLFYNSYHIDGYSQLFKVMIAFGVAALLLFGKELKDIDLSVKPEYYMFLFLSCLGLMMLVSSVELIALFVSLELSSFALYLLVPMRNDSKGIRVQMEAGIKYILFGVMATGFMLYGMSYLYGLTGTTNLQEIVASLGNVANQPVAVFAVTMVLVGFLYKLAVFPMHFWVPDIYQGASNETTGFIATIPKLGAVALLIRIVDALVPAGNHFVINLLMVMAVCSMFYGNLSALVQKDIKRMLGFSGISHAGFILLGLLTLDNAGYATAIYYISGYVVMNLACFLVISNVSQQGENLVIEDFNGLYKRQPVLAFILTIGLFALAGIPPFVGFMGKFFLLTEALRQDHLPLVVMAAINTAIAIYYYLSVVKAAYTTDPENRPEVEIDFLTKAVGIALIACIIGMGALPAQFVKIAQAAVETMVM